MIKEEVEAAIASGETAVMVYPGNGGLSRSGRPIPAKLIGWNQSKVVVKPNGHRVTDMVEPDLVQRWKKGNASLESMRKGRVAGTKNLAASEPLIIVCHKHRTFWYRDHHGAKWVKRVEDAVQYACDGNARIALGRMRTQGKQAFYLKDEVPVPVPLSTAKRLEAEWYGSGAYAITEIKPPVSPPALRVVEKQLPLEVQQAMAKPEAPPIPAVIPAAASGLEAFSRYEKAARDEQVAIELLYDARKAKECASIDIEIARKRSELGTESRTISR